MKTMKVALLATAALAAVSVSARADETAAIKAQLEALTARIAQLEAAPAVPVGYSMLTVTTVDALSLTGERAADVVNKTSHRISVLPTADMPAATTIDWDLYVRAAIYYLDYDTSSEDSAGIDVRGRIRVKATTDTSVGTVGVDLRVEGDNFFDSNDGAAYGDFTMDIAWGWWQMTPEWTLGGGYTGSLSDPGHGMDGWLTYGTTFFYGQGDQQQFRLTYNSGPLTWAVALEDGNDDDVDEHGAFQVASRLDYAGDAFAASLSGWYGPADISGYDDAWQVAAGADFTLSDMVTLSASGAIGHRFDGDDYSSINGFVGFGLSDTVSLEAGAGYGWEPDDADGDVTKFNVGVYWTPADQLKMGLQADMVDYDDEVKGVSKDVNSISFVTFFTY